MKKTRKQIIEENRRLKGRIKDLEFNKKQLLTVVEIYKSLAQKRKK